MENENIIDFGNISVPKGWGELTLKQFSEIQRYYSDKESSFDARDVLHILSNLELDKINEMPMEFTEKILEALEWLTEPPKYGKPTNRLTIDGIDYVVNVQDKLKTGEFIAVQTILKDDKENYAAILAILCRKDGETYDSKFENEVLGDRIEFWERQPMIECMRVINFFLQLCMKSQIVSQAYSRVEEVLDLTQRNIETLESVGAFKRLCMKWRMRKLRKSLKSIKST
jgi:hypothetical protein